MSKILLIEPDKILAGNIKTFFKRRGHSVHAQASAQTGIDAADKLKPDAVILDLQLSGHSGIEFLHELRSYADWQSLPVVVFSSLNPDQLGGEDAAKASLTISAYVHKPTASLANLAKAVEQSLPK